MVDDEKGSGVDSPKEEEIALAWVMEAERRNQKMEETGDEGIPAEEVFRRLRSRTGQAAEHEESTDPR